MIISEIEEKLRISAHKIGYKRLQKIKSVMALYPYDTSEQCTKLKYHAFIQKCMNKGLRVNIKLLLSMFIMIPPE